MRSLDWTAIQVCVVTSRNRNWHSKNMVMENASWFSTVGLGSHRRTCPCRLHGESDECPTSDSVALLGEWKVTIPDMAPLTIHVDQTIGMFWNFMRLGRGGAYIILICSEKRHTSNVILPMSCWAGWANHHLTSHKCYPFGARIDVSRKPASTLQALLLRKNIQN